MSEDVKVNDPEMVDNAVTHRIMSIILEGIGSAITSEKYYKDILQRILVVCTDAMKNDRTPEMTTYDIGSVVSSSTGMPRVNISVSGEGATLHTQVDVKKAQDIALHILEAAEAAMTDAFMVQFARDKLEQTDETATLMLMWLRDYRRQFPIRRGWYES